MLAGMRGRKVKDSVRKTPPTAFFCASVRGAWAYAAWTDSAIGVRGGVERKDSVIGVHGACVRGHKGLRHRGAWTKMQAASPSPSPGGSTMRLFVRGPAGQTACPEPTPLSTLGCVGIKGSAIGASMIRASTLHSSTLKDRSG